MSRLISDEDLAKLDELEALIKEAYDWYMNRTDGCSKSSEGGLGLDFGNYFERYARPRVEVWSYVFGPSRSHWFDNVDEALEAFKEWYAEARLYGV